MSTRRRGSTLIPCLRGFTLFPRLRGFTLIELLVALFITAIVFAIGYGGLNQALQHRDTIKEHEDRLSKVQGAVETLVQDFAQASARPIRDPLGSTWLPCFVAQSTQDTLGSDSSASAATSSASTTSSGPGADDTGDVDLVVFTRAGWTNPAGVQRGTLERVSYRFNDGKLWRMHWAVLDGAEGSLPLHRQLLDQVKSVSFRFMDTGRNWVNQWPEPGNSAMRTRPLAVEVTLELNDWGRIVRLIEVPA